MDMAWASAIARNGSETLLLLAALGVVTGLSRWKYSVNKPLFASVIVFLLFTAAREIPVWVGGMTGWGAEMVMFSGLARWGQSAAACLFIWVTMRERCSPWARALLIAGVLLIVWMI